MQHFSDRATTHREESIFPVNALCISRKLRSRSEQHFDRLSKTRTATYYANQYTSIARNQTAFDPTFDTDGNQTLVQTSTGIWTVAYNAENRPISFTKTEADQTTIIECGYDYMGRRSMKKVTVNGAITLHLRYIYRGYLQIACVDLLRGDHPALWYTLWDPSESVATRPLAIQKNGTWYTYGHDLTKNVMELYNADGTIATTYDYTPFGAVTATGIDQAFQWSSEVYDSELALTYYNYRHYNPMDGRWINRDPIAEQGGQNLYAFVGNGGTRLVDTFGLVAPGYEGALCAKQYIEIQDKYRVPKKNGLDACDKYKKSKCCKDNELIDDSYIDKAKEMCKSFIEKYSVNDMVIPAVECVAKCLVRKEEETQKEKDCSQRNKLRLNAHVSCYAECQFYLTSSSAMGVPDGGRGIGFKDLLPDWIKCIFN